MRGGAHRRRPASSFGATVRAPRALVRGSLATARRRIELVRVPVLLAGRHGGISLRWTHGGVHIAHTPHCRGAGRGGTMLLRTSDKTRDDEEYDGGLPIPTQIVSNSEYYPIPQT